MAKKVDVNKLMANTTIEVCYVGHRRLKVRFLMGRAIIRFGVWITGARYVYVGTKANDKGWWNTVSWDADIGKPRTVEIDGDFYTAQGR